MRNAISGDLDVMRDEAFTKHALNVQTAIRGHLMRRRFKSWHNIIMQVDEAVKVRTAEAVSNALDACAELPFHGVHLQQVKDAKVLQQRLVEEKQVAALVDSAIAQRDLESLRSAVVAANAMNPPLDPAICPALTGAEAIIKELEAEIALKKEIVAAVNKRDLALIDELLLKSEQIDLDQGCEEVKQAKALKDRLEEEKQVMEDLDGAVERRDLSALSAFLKVCGEMGLSNAKVDEARNLETQLVAEEEAKSALAAAKETRIAVGLQQALTKAYELGLGASQEYADANALYETILAEDAVLTALQTATTSRDIASLEENIAKADGMGLQSANPVRSEYTNAVKMCDTIKKENECTAALTAAVSSGDKSALSAALATASALGMTGDAVSAANEALSKLGAENEMQGKLLAAGNLTSQAEIEALIAKAEGLGLAGSTEMASAKESLERFKKGAELVAKLPGATNFDILTTLIGEAELLGLDAKFPTEMAAARKNLEHLTIVNQCETNLDACIASKDTALIQQWLDYASQQSCESEKITEARKIQRKLAAENELIEKISKALEAKDTATLKTLIAEADKKSVTGDKVSQAKVFADRENLVKETYAKIKKSGDDCDLALMNEAFDMVIQLGLEGPEIEAAKVKRDELTALDTVQKGLSAAMKTVEVKVYSKGGIVEGDSQPLEAAIADAKSKGVPDTTPTMVAATNLLENMGKQIGVQQQCAEALEAGDKASLKAALKAVEDLELNLESKDLIKITLKELKDHENMLLEESGGVTEAPDMNDLNAEEIEDERMARRQEAMGTKYRFWNFSNLRSPDDYAKGILLNKKKVKEGMLKHQENLIPKSLLDLSRENNKKAIDIHRCMLGYMGEKQMSFPATLAHDILTKGLEHPLMRDELFMQLMKQLSHNPKAESIAKGWQLMCMCVSTFPPSDEFDHFVLNFILSKTEGHGAVKNYAKYALRTLEGMMTSGASGFVPCVEEIAAYKERPPVLATVELVDGQILSTDLPVTPDLAVGKVTEICAHFLEMQDELIEHMGLFVYDVPGEIIDPGVERKPENPMIKDLPRTPRPLRSSDFLGDIIVQKARQGRNFKFVFKKKIFLEATNGPPTDPQYSRVVYLQAEDEVITSGNLRFDNIEDIINLAALSMMHNYLNEGGYPHDVDGFYEVEGMSFIPESWQYAMTEEEWVQTMIGRASYAEQFTTVLEVQHAFLAICEKNPYYGGHLFCCKKAFINLSDESEDFDLPDLITLCYREDGLHFFSDNYEHLFHCGFADIIRWGGSSRQFSLVIWNADSESTFEVMLHTPQAADMAACILDHIDHIMQYKNMEEEEEEE